MFDSLTIYDRGQPAMLCKRIGVMLGMMLVMTTLMLGGTQTAFAAADPPAGDDKNVGLGKVAARLTSTLPAFVNLIIAGCYVAGMALAGAAILKFKAHKDNPTQVPLGTPIALLFIGAALLWLPSIIKSTGQSMFDETDQKAGLGGPELTKGGGWGSTGGGS